MFLDRLRQKIGPLPVWAWGLLIGGAAVAYMMWTNRRAGSAGNVSAPADSTSAGSDAIDGAFTPGTTSGGGGLTEDQQDNLADSGSIFQNNQTWEAKAVAWLSSQGASPLAAQRALEQYLNGEAITQDYRTKYVDPAVGHFGLPPDGTLGPVHVVPNPTTTTTTTTTTHTPAPIAHTPPPTKAAKPKSTTYVIRSGDNLTSIARRYGTTVQKIAAANHIGNVNKINAGQKLVIPK